MTSPDAARGEREDMHALKQGRSTCGGPTWFKVLMLCAVAGLANQPLLAQSEEIDDAVAACRDAGDLAESGDLEAAIEEARWCLEVLEGIAQDAALTLFPDVLDGWVAGELGNQSALGMVLLTRDYRRDGELISVSVTTGAAGSGLAALAQLGAQFIANGATRFRVQRRPVMDISSDGGDRHFLVELRSGGVLNLQSSTADKETLRAFLEAFPVAAIDDALRS